MRNLMILAGAALLFTGAAQAQDTTPPTGPVPTSPQPAPTPTPTPDPTATPPVDTTTPTTTSTETQSTPDDAHSQHKKDKKQKPPQ